MKNRGKGVNKDMFEVYMQNSATEYSITRTLRARLARALGIFQQKNIRVLVILYSVALLLNIGINLHLNFILFSLFLHIVLLGFMYY